MVLEIECAILSCLFVLRGFRGGGIESVLDDTKTHTNLR